MNTRLPIPVFSLLLAAFLLPAPASAQKKSVPPLFHPADRCMACHNQLTTAAGEDVSIGFDWRSSMMGNAGRDPYWMAAVRRETLDHPQAAAAIEDKCTVCHLGMARTQNLAEGDQGWAFRNFPVLGAGGARTALAQDGVSCTLCHQLQDQKLGSKESFTGGYVVDTTAPAGERVLFGPFEVDAGRGRLMQSSSDFHPKLGNHLQSAEVCATCHTLFTHALDPEGNEVGEFPEQVPYLEWKHSAYAGVTTCQDCHMPVVEGEVSVSGVLPLPRKDVSRHTFRGGNFFMPRLLNRYRTELGVRALPRELEATARQAAENLGGRTARLQLEPTLVDGSLEVKVSVLNLAGHKLPSAYPSRRAWIRFRVKGARGQVIFESGALRPDGAIEGNDNDADASRYEPHHPKISSADQVQIYEDIIVDHAGEVTTGLLRGVRYIKDNRLLPDGFDKETATPEVAVQGAALADDDFVGGGDSTLYAVAVGEATGPFTVEAALWYQPIGYRWARNLADYETRESAQFLEFFDAMSSSSAARITRATASIAAPEPPPVAQEEDPPGPPGSDPGP